MWCPVVKSSLARVPSSSSLDIYSFAVHGRTDSVLLVKVRRVDGKKRGNGEEVDKRIAAPVARCRLTVIPYNNQ